MFESLAMAPPDPILGLADAFKKDPRAEKINLGVGVYLDDTGKVPTLPSVREAARRVFEANPSTSYLSIDGLPEYNQRVQELLLGEGSKALAEGRAATAQTPGGTGALRVAGDFLKQITDGQPTIWLSDETWANHQGIFRAAGFDVKTYPYYDAQTRGLKFDAMIEAIGKIPSRDVILLHGCCHNPTGIDPDPAQWRAIVDAINKQELFPLFDFAYQGLAVGLDEDALGIRLMADSGRPAMVASSFSKNFSLYNERVGALTVLGSGADEAQIAMSHVKLAIRTNYSNPPRTGGALAATILGDPGLRAQWVGEVAGIRQRIHKMRTELVEGLHAAGTGRDFSFIARQKGMFSYSGLTPDQVGALKEKHAIYIVKNGRISVAGLTSSNIGRFIASVADVLRAA